MACPKALWAGIGEQTCDGCGEQRRGRREEAPIGRPRPGLGTGEWGEDRQQVTGGRGRGRTRVEGDLEL
jgi:hypothetical protein